MKKGEKERKEGEGQKREKQREEKEDGRLVDGKEDERRKKRGERGYYSLKSKWHFGT